MTDRLFDLPPPARRALADSELEALDAIVGASLLLARVDPAALSRAIEHAEHLPPVVDGRASSAHVDHAELLIAARAWQNATRFVGPALLTALAGVDLEADEHAGGRCPSPYPTTTKGPR